MRLSLLQREGCLPQIVTSDGEVVEGVRMIEVRHEVQKPVLVTIEFIDRAATEDMVRSGLIGRKDAAI